MIVTEEELIVKVINGATPGVVRIVSAGENKTFVSSGFFVSADGVITASAAAVLAAASTTSYQAILADGHAVALTKLTPVTDLSFFKLDPPADSVKWSKLTLAKVLPAIGQTVVALGYSDRPDINVSVGIVSSFLSTDASTTPFVMTNAASPENQGGPVLNIKGEVIGMSKGSGLVISAEAIAAALTGLK